MRLVVGRRPRQRSEPVHSIAVTQQIPWGSIPREGFEKLPGSPFLSGKGSDGEMKRTSAIMVKDQEDEEDLEGHRWDEEEFYGDEVLDMVVDKGAPGLRGRCAGPYIWRRLLERVRFRSSATLRECEEHSSGDWQGVR